MKYALFRMRLTSSLCVLSLGMWWAAAVAQDSVTFLPSDVLARVWAGHPVAAAANLRAEAASAQLQAARGKFDPTLTAGSRQKDWNETLYYRERSVDLDLPTPLGLDVELGYIQSDGTYLNPEANTPAGGLLQAGVSIDLVQGLRIDARRAALQKAKLAQELGEVERRALLNELTAEALDAYWNWFDAWHQVAVFANSVTVAKQRLDAVIQSAAQGDRPALDTLEAGIQVLNRQQLHLAAEQNLIKSRAYLETFLWTEGNQPLMLSTSAVPPDLETASELLRENPTIRPDWLASHPLVLSGTNAIDQSTVDLRWKKEQLKPELSVKYAWMDAAQAFPGESTWDANPNSVGLEFAFPLFIRAERGQLRLAEVDLATRGWNLMEQKRKLQLSSDAMRNVSPLLVGQWTVQNRAVRDSKLLLEGERVLFQAGESSLFLINMREQYYIQTQLKAIEILHKLAENRMDILALEAAWW